MDIYILYQLLTQSAFERRFRIQSKSMCDHLNQYTSIITLDIETIERGLNLFRNEKLDTPGATPDVKHPYTASPTQNHPCHIQLWTNL